MGEDLMDDLICTFEGAVGGVLPDLGTFVAAVLLWATLGGAVIALAALILRRGDGGEERQDRELAARSEEIIANKIAELKKESAARTTTAASSSSNGGGAIPRAPLAAPTPPKVEVSPAPQVAPPVAPVEKASSSSSGSGLRIPVSVGSDGDAVAWVNTCLRALWQSDAARRSIERTWMDALRECGRVAAQEVQYSIATKYNNTSSKLQSNAFCRLLWKVLSTSTSVLLAHTNYCRSRFSFSATSPLFPSQGN